MKFSGKVWSDDLIKFWVNSSKQVGGSKVNLFSPTIAQRTGINKSVSFARWQQVAGFVVPRTTVCLFLCSFMYHYYFK